MTTTNKYGTRENKRGVVVLWVDNRVASGKVKITPALVDELAKANDLTSRQVERKLAKGQKVYTDPNDLSIYYQQRKVELTPREEFQLPPLKQQQKFPPKADPLV